MTKNNRNYLLGVLAGFMGMGLYSLMLKGLSNITFNDVYYVVEDLIIPFIFTEVCTAIGVEGLHNLKVEFIQLKEKLNKKSKEAEA